MGWSFFNDVFRCTERDVPCGAMCAFGTLRIKNVIASVAWQSPGRAPCHKPHARYCIMGPNGILCTRWEKEYASVRQTFVACDDCLVKNEAYDAEEKAHTNKRVSVIACDNAISKAQCAPRGKTIPPQLRWYCLLMCFRIKELWIVICVNFGEREDFLPVRRSTARRLPLSFRSPKNLQEGFRPHTDYTCRWLRVRALTGLSPAPVF